MEDFDFGTGAMGREVRAVRWWVDLDRGPRWRRVREGARERMLGVAGVERASMYDVRWWLWVCGGEGRESGSEMGNRGVRGARERWLREGCERRLLGEWRLYATWGKGSWC